jgi:hypothetical protein
MPNLQKVSWFNLKMVLPLFSARLFCRCSNGILCTGRSDHLTSSTIMSSLLFEEDQMLQEPSLLCLYQSRNRARVSERNSYRCATIPPASEISTISTADCKHGVDPWSSRRPRAVVGWMFLFIWYILLRTELSRHVFRTTNRKYNS